MTEAYRSNTVVHNPAIHLLPLLLRGFFLGFLKMMQIVRITEAA